MAECPYCKKRVWFWQRKVKGLRGLFLFTPNIPQPVAHKDCLEANNNG